MNFSIVVVFQTEPITSGNASICIFRLTKLESNVRTLRFSRHSQSQSQDVLVIQPKSVVRHCYKTQKRSNTKCNMSSSKANLRTNQSFVCVKTIVLLCPRLHAANYIRGYGRTVRALPIFTECLPQVRSGSLRAISATSLAFIEHHKSITKIGILFCFDIWVYRNMARRRVFKIYIK